MMEWRSDGIWEKTLAILANLARGLSGYSHKRHILLRPLGLRRDREGAGNSHKKAQKHKILNS